MSYYVYQLTSPSGKYYIGITKNVDLRWGSHKRKARSAAKKHPLYDAIRHYGAENFTVSTLLTLHTEAEARSAEVTCIALFNATDRSRGYNISPGGEYDGATGAKEFWARIRSNPVDYADYIDRLSRGCKKRGALNIGALISANQALPARERWKRAYRALRLARHAPHSRSSKDQTAPEKRLKMSEAVRKAWVSSPESHKKRHSMSCRKSAKAQWARLSEEEKAEVFSKISVTLIERHRTNDAYHRGVSAQLKEARQKIDRSVQAPAASRGLKKFWAELKQDPDKYTAYIEARTAALKAANDRKARK